MAAKSGISAQIGYAIEAVPGTPSVATAFIPLLSDGMGGERERLESDGIIPGRRVLDSTMYNGGKLSAGGDVQHELYNRGLGKLFTGMFGTVVSTTGPVSGKYTHTWTPNEPQPLTVQKGVPATSGTVWPFTYPTSMVESWEIACSAGEIGTIGVTLASATEILYRTVTDGVTTSGSAAITSATAAWVDDDLGKPISGTGIPAGTTLLSIQSATNATMSANASASGTGVTFTVGIALAAASYPATLKPFKFNHGSVTVNGVAQKVKQLTVSGDNGLDTDRWFLGQLGRDQPLEAGLHAYDGSFEIEFSSMTQMQRFVAGDNFPCVVAFANSSGDSLTLTMNVRFDGETPKVGGRDIVSQNLAFKCVGTTDAAAITAVLVNADATP